MCVVVLLMSRRVWTPAPEDTKDVAKIRYCNQGPGPEVAALVRNLDFEAHRGRLSLTLRPSRIRRNHSSSMQTWPRHVVQQAVKFRNLATRL
ncbi:hypothetical protein CLCR_11079 [Cladophialophora carrionii]|uniref:Uncharacterized protein n=1 Tax=Cladophialophora carrionii TaxID=86049 RepID=A0A1C1CXA4_9EURO|nr:hypothetical protein CLCR_11079 [Cladophialophora carrionii]